MWVSFAQLYVDFQLTWGVSGPLKVHGQWVDMASRPYLDVERFDFKQRLKWFRQFLKALWGEAAVGVSLQQCRPKSESIQAFVQSVALPWNPRALHEVEVWFGQHLKELCVRSAGALKCLPLASQSGSMKLETG